jgi:hypothetical protein
VTITSWSALDRVWQAQSRSETAAFEAFWIRHLGADDFFRRYWSDDCFEGYPAPDPDGAHRLVEEFLCETGETK